MGLDLSRPLLREARRRLGAALPLIAADMRRLPLAPRFDALLSFFTSFGYFSEESEDRRVIEEMARVVVPGGGLLLDLPDRDTTIDRLVPESEREERGIRIEERRWLSPDRKRVEKEICIRQNDGAEERTHESVRLYSRPEIEEILTAECWRPVDIFGDFSGAPWRRGVGPRMIMIARREDVR